MSFLRRFRKWWNADAVERADEEPDATPLEREREQEDYEAGKDDVFLREHLNQEGVDYERDSEAPRP
jgi:hypothetical protein